MRFTALALGVLGLASFAVGEAGNPKTTSSSRATSSSASRLTRPHPPATSTPTRSVKSHPIYDSSTRTVEHTPLFHVEVPTVTGFHVGEAASSSAEISLTLPMTSTCNEGSTTLEQLQQTSVCTDPKTQSLDTRPCAASFYKYYVCLATATPSTKSNDFGGTRSPRWVAQFARATPVVADPLPAAAREARVDPKFAARAAREAHHIPKFGHPPAITPVPRAPQITPPPFPICTFNLDKGEYICPEKAKRQALPVCSFDLSKGEYVCPKPLCTFDLSKGEYVCPRVTPRTAMPEEMAEVVATTLKTVIKV